VLRIQSAADPHRLGNVPVRRILVLFIPQSDKNTCLYTLQNEIGCVRYTPVQRLSEKTNGGLSRRCIGKLGASEALSSTASEPGYTASPSCTALHTLPMSRWCCGAPSLARLRLYNMVTIPPTSPFSPHPTLASAAFRHARRHSRKVLLACPSRRVSSRPPSRADTRSQCTCYRDLFVAECTARVHPGFVGVALCKA
jgi:hypothetical protein